MRKRSILLLGGAVAIIASLVVGPAATAGPERASAGTAVIIHDQEPGILNPFLSEGNGYTVAAGHEQDPQCWLDLQQQGSGHP